MTKSLRDLKEDRCPWCGASRVIEPFRSTTTEWECGSSIGCAHQRQSHECRARRAAEQQTHEPELLTSRESRSFAKPYSHEPDPEYTRFDADSYCVVHLRPNSDVVQMTSNVADARIAEMYAKQIEQDGGHVFAAVPAGVLIAALMHIRPEARRPGKQKGG